VLPIDPLHTRKLLLFEINEVNFEVARLYVDELGLKGFKALLAGPQIRTSSESAYEQLEPWIQWVSAHSGQTAAEHGVFRLGDIVGTAIPQMFEQLEEKGVLVGCVSAMNAENRLKKPAYFVPDPWTSTPTDGSFWSKSLGAAVSQAVNDNAKGRISLQSVAALALGLVRFARPSNYATYASLAFRSRGAPWRRALFLDLFLHDFHWSLLKSRKPRFSTLFLNAGAHIQHHYLFNSKAVANTGQRNPEWYADKHVDPFAEMLTVYDRIIGDYLSLQPSFDVVIATGLTQQPYERLKYYYRLTDHTGFLKKVGIAFDNVLPRMTRDFLVVFKSAADASAAVARLVTFRGAKDGAPIFGDIENRGASVFLSLVYPSEIDVDFVAEYDGGQMPLAPWVTFVAIKNGMHNPNGFAFFRGEIAKYAPEEGAHVKDIYGTVMGFFGAVSFGADRSIQ
jgi:hypothetical protein